jgi:hypothetical protein
MSLVEQAPPMSLHVGLVRVGYQQIPMLDVLYDTTETDRNVRAFCHVMYHPVFEQAKALAGANGVDLGVPIKGYDPVSA